MFAKLHKTLISAGEILRTHWNRSYSTRVKADGSPVTPADLEVSEFVTAALQEHFSYPVVSEENVPIWEMRRDYTTYWLLDPLDGTKEFIGRYGDFSICIALIRNKKPILGVIYAPALNIMYYAGENVGAFCYDQGKKERIGHKTPIQVVAMTSRFHNDPKVAEFCQKNAIQHTYIAGGALKYCYLAEGKGSVYIRYNKMKEWDVAPGEIILREAGGCLLTLEGENLVYNNETLSVPPFIATAYGVASASFDV